MKRSGTIGSKVGAISLAMSMSLSGCTSFSPIEHDPATSGDTDQLIRSSCSDFSIDMEHDVKVGDEIRYTTCDGVASSMTVATIDHDRITGDTGEIDVRDLRSMKVKSVSVGKSLLLGAGVSAAAVVAAILVFGATISAAILAAHP